MMPREMTPRQLETTFTQEILDLERGGHRFLVDLAPSQAISLAGQLQLALRHPGNAGPSCELALTMVRQIERFFRTSPAVLEVIRLGWEETP